jgi:uncharacterized protein
MENCCSTWQVEFSYQVGDLLYAPEVQALHNFPHHHRASRYDHALLVAQLSFRVARTFGLDCRATARCSLLHDLYSGCKDSSSPFFFLRHAWTHPKRALKNAQTLTYLTGKEQNIIASHMWPMCKALPKSREAWLVNVVDSFVAVIDVLGWNHMILRSKP